MKRLERLNFHHLLNFWLLAKEGGLKPAAERLGVSHSAVWAHVHSLEGFFGRPLVRREGRKLVLTGVGERVWKEADALFAQSRTLLEVAAAGDAPARAEVRIGLSDAVPKLVARRLLAPLFAPERRFRVVCHENDERRLVAALAAQDLDFLLLDAPPTKGAVRLFVHRLLESPLGWYAHPSLAPQLKRRFPAALAEVPVLLPTDGTAARDHVDRWLERRALVVDVIGELDDGALMKTIAEEIPCAFIAPTVVGPAMKDLYGAVSLGPLEGAQAEFVAVTTERAPGSAALRLLVREARR